MVNEPELMRIVILTIDLYIFILSYGTKMQLFCMIFAFFILCTSLLP